jgi:hypothetical protein
LKGFVNPITALEFTPDKLKVLVIIMGKTVLDPVWKSGDGF